MNFQLNYHGIKTIKMAENKKRKVKLVIVEEFDDVKPAVVEYSGANLFVKLQHAGLDTLISIFRKEFNKGFTNMKSSRIPLERRRMLIKNAILEEIEKQNVQETFCKKLLETYFAPPPSRVYETDWLSEFAVGEEVLFNQAYRPCRLAVIEKINKKSLSVRLYGYTEIWDRRAMTNQTSGIDRLVWNKAVDDGKKTIFKRGDIIKRGQERHYDEEFVEGQRSVDYGN